MSILEHHQDFLQQSSNKIIKKKLKLTLIKCGKVNLNELIDSFHIANLTQLASILNDN